MLISAAAMQYDKLYEPSLSVITNNDLSIGRETVTEIPEGYRSPSEVVNLSNQMSKSLEKTVSPSIRQNVHNL